MFDFWRPIVDVFRRPEYVADPQSGQSFPTGRLIPYVIPDEQIAAIKHLDGTEEPLTASRRRFAKGDKVRITDGPFTSEAVLTVDSVNVAKLRAVMLMDFLGQQVPTEVPIEQLERVG